MPIARQPVARQFERVTTNKNRQPAGCPNVASQG